MLISEKAKPLLQELLDVNEQEGDSVKALHDYLAAGGNDTPTMLKLAAEMDKAHTRKIELHAEIKKYQVDR